MQAIDIARRTQVASPETLGGRIFVWFDQDPDLHIIPIVQNGKPVGLVTRQRLLEHFSHKFGRELWEKRPIAQLMNSDPRIVDSCMPIETICRSMAEMSLQALMEGVVFVDALGLYAGVASAFDLYQASVNLSEAKNRELLTVSAQLSAETQKANNASSAKTNFLATMSHEIRTPLNGILGMAQALALEELPADQREKIDIIVSSGETLTVLLNDVLDLSKIEAGRLDISPVDMDLRTTIERARKLFEAIANDKDVAIRVTLPETAQTYLHYDAVRVHQCLSNLISNAVKFTPSGEVEIIGSVTEPDARGVSRVELQVRDTGIGMAPDTVANLFTPFTQADGSITRNFGGTGLGLAITRRLARLMNGDVTVASAASCGSTFFLSFEAGAAISAPALAAVAPSIGSSNSSRTGPLRILLVDDNAVNRQVARLFLASLQTTVVEAENGAEALKRLGEREFDVVLLDVHMPIMDGCEAIRRIRASDQPWRTLPVIALTADAMEGDRERFVAMGMTDYLAKPIDRRLLLNKIHEATSRTVTHAATDVLHATSADDPDLSDILDLIEASAA
ncbi:MAG TPA: response regulator [Hyphomonadaceae bacterium]|nr:response regulator [Hyphomonadaceae bacterium]